MARASGLRLICLRGPCVLFERRICLFGVLVISRGARWLRRCVVSTRHLLQVKSGQSLCLLWITSICIAHCSDFWGGLTANCCTRCYVCIRSWRLSGWLSMLKAQFLMLLDLSYFLHTSTVGLHSAMCSFIWYRVCCSSRLFLFYSDSFTCWHLIHVLFDLCLWLRGKHLCW